MKTLRYLIFGLLATAVASQAQTITQPGFYQANNYAVTPVTAGSRPAQAQISGGQGFSPMYSQDTPIAETITPDIQALADGLQDNPLKIFNYVHDHVKFVLYFGSKKGAELTLLEKSGNDFDQCALLVALLRAAGYSPGYAFGLMKLPLDATDGTQNDLRHWWHLTIVNTNWSNTETYFSYLLGKRGYPTFITGYDENTIGLQRVWVTVTIGGTNYVLDPAFKVSEPVDGINLATATGLSSNAVMTAAGGTDTANYVTNLNEANLRGLLTGYTTNLLNYLQSNAPNASVDQILGGWQIVSSTNTTLSQSLLFGQDTATLPVEDWTDEPTNLMSSLTINFASTNYQWWMPKLQGDRITLLYTTNGLAQLWQDDTLLVTNQTTASDTNVILSANHPYGTWNFTDNVLVDNGNDDQTTTNVYQRTNATYCIMYAFEPDWGWLQKRQQQLDAYRQAGLADNSRQVVSETLNIMGLGWMLQTAYADRVLSEQLGVLPEYVHRLGRMAQEGGKGYYVDVYMQESGGFADSGTDTASQNNQNSAFDLSSYFWSAMEHGIIQQLQDSNLVAASTVKMLEIANTNHQAVYLADSANWSTVQGSLVGYNLTSLGNLIGEGYTLLLPRSGTNQVAGSGTWKGYGLVARYQSGSYESMQMLIGGGYNGGYVSEPGATANPSYVDQSSDSQPFFFDNASALTFNTTAGDPVDMANGTFQVENTDLALGQAEPRGITLSRYYNGTRHDSNPSGMADGWVNDYTVNASAVAAPQAALGGTTPAQMAPMLVASAAAAALYNGQSLDAKNWTVTALIAKWAIDQLDNSGVSINLGKDTVQFVEQPNGVFTPPANCTMTLIQTNSAYWLEQRHGNTFKFNAAGYLTNIVDQYGQSLNLTYNSSNWVSTVKDWKNRQFTFTYSGTPSRLTSVSDGTRTVNYGYSTTYSPQGDLTSFTDAEGKTSTYQYDTNHDIAATFDAQTRLVVSNNYDSLGHVTTQLTEGDTNQLWHIFWSGWQTIAQDPAGGQQTYFYDDQSRLIGSQDALGNLTQTFYDGQDHVVESISPLDETNQYFYDGNNNLIETIDSLGFTNQFVYGSNNNLIRSVDGRGDVSTFGYNAEFSLTGQTNGAGDWLNYIYNTSGSAIGTLASKTDAGGTTSYGYDSTYGQLTSITYPGSLGSESFGNDKFGDVTNHTDARGFATAFQYDNRRELTNTIAPTNLITSISFDAEGNVASTTDERGNVTYNTWSATHKLLTTTLPTVAAGSPVITRSYDNRDWLAKTVDPLEEQTLYTNNANGWLISKTDPALRTTTFGFDSDGRKLMTVNAANETNSQTWDGRGDLITLTDGAGHTSLRAYDGAGNQVILTNRNGKVWQFRFDGDSRLTNTIPPSPMQPSYQVYNSRGLLASAKDPAGQTTSYYYDAKGRLTNRTDNVGTTLYSYDVNDNRTNVAGNSLTNTWTYDAYNRISAYKDAYGNFIQYKYDADGNLTNLIYPGGKNVYYTYDNGNHLTQVRDWSGRVTTFGHDLAGRLTSITRPNGTQRIISYDSAGEATNILEETAVGFPIALFRLNWNAADEMQWEFAAPLPHTNAPPTRTMTYHDDNELATVDGADVTEDLDGNLTDGPLTNDDFVTYTFDARNRLLSAGGVTNFYDAANTRIGQLYGTNSVIYVVNPNAKLPQVLMRIKNGVTNYYVYGVGLLYQVTETATATNTLTYHYDYRGSTVALTDDSGNVQDRFEYSLYATLTYRAGADDTPFLFNGRYGVVTDPNGLLYMQARYYNPYLCRFVSADPSGFSGGLNMYAAFSGNPVSLTDPFGLGVGTSIFGGLRMVGGAIEATVGFTFAGVTSESIVGAVAGGAVGLHGVDSMQTGFRQMISGQQVDSFTSQGLQAAGVPETYANLTDAGISIVGTAGTSFFGATSASGPLVQLTDSAGGAAINNSGTLIGEGGIYAGPLDNAGASGLNVTWNTGLLPSSYEAAVPIPAAAEGAFSSVQPTGLITGWQALTGQAYTQAGVLDLSSGIFTQTGVNFGQAAFYGIDAASVNGGAFVGTSLSSSTGK